MNTKRMVLLVVAALTLLSAPAAQAFYHPHTGRWLSRDPIGEGGGMCLDGFVNNSPICSHDVLGMWRRNVHRDATISWAFEANFSVTYASIIGEADQGVDSNWGTSSLPGGDLGRHMLVLGEGGQDSRVAYYAAERALALRHLANAGRTHNPHECAVAAAAFGRGLHSLQDRFAHRPYPGGISWVPTIVHPWWWDAWSIADMFESAPWFNSELWWRDVVHQPPIYYPYAQEDFVIQAQQEQAQQQMRAATITASREALGGFAEAIRGVCICRGLMLMHP